MQTYSRRPSLLIPAATIFVSFVALPHAHAQDGIQIGYGDLSSSGTGSTILSGLNINTLLGANTFYNAGYTGSKAIIANVEGGLIWNGHATLTQDAKQIFSPQADAEYDFHATWVGSNLNGRAPASPEPCGYYDSGIAYGATVWSGAVAAAWVGGGNTAFYFRNSDTAYAYYNAMITETTGGAKADVVNSSWGYSDAGGTSTVTRFVDALIYQTGETFVAAAGNNGYGTNTVQGMASGYNSISVGATGNDTDARPYQTVASFSSGGPSDYVSASGTTISGARARVDIVAPGQNFTLANYQGTTGGNTGVTSPAAGTTPTGGNTTTDSFTSTYGTSFSSPTVAGGAALLVDAGKTVYASNASAIDGRVIKAVLLNSADKLAGFDNGTTVQAGTGALVTTQALDYKQGSGQMNLMQAAAQYLTGDHDVTLVNGAATITKIGWDFDTVALGASNNYNFGTSLLAGSTLTATLDWFVADSYTYSVNVQTGIPNAPTALTDRYDNLYLSLYEVIAPGTFQLIGESEANYITTQQLYLNIPATGSYFLRVTDAGQQYNDGTFTGNTSYGLAWNVSSNASAPEPAPLALLLTAGATVGLALRRRRRRAI